MCMSFQAMLVACVEGASKSMCVMVGYRPRSTTHGHELPKPKGDKFEILIDVMRYLCNGDDKDVDEEESGELDLSS